MNPVQTSEWFLRKRWKCDEYNRFYFYPYGTQKTVEFFRKRISHISPVWATKDCVFCWKPWEPNIFLSEHFSLHECSLIASFFSPLMFINCFINSLIKSWTVRSIRVIRVQINGILWGNFWTLMFQTRFAPFVRFVFKLTAFCEAIFEHYCFKHCSFHSIRVLQNAAKFGEESDGFAISVPQNWHKFRGFLKFLS